MDHVLHGNTIADRRARCRQCRALLVDCEPASWNGDWYHRPGPCPKAGKTVLEGDYVAHLRKAERRARDRGARRAAKLRPR